MKNRKKILHENLVKRFEKSGIKYNDNDYIAWIENEYIEQARIRSLMETESQFFFDETQMLKAKLEEINN